MMANDGGAFGRAAAAARSGYGFRAAPTFWLHMVGGLILSQLLTLFTTPVVYLYLERVNLLLVRRGRGPTHEAAQPAG
jgi:HAE1 family hydrophobic/amphiphilic exporter-1